MISNQHLSHSYYSLPSRIVLILGLWWCTLVSATVFQKNQLPCQQPRSLPWGVQRVVPTSARAIGCSSSTLLDFDNQEDNLEVEEQNRASDATAEFAVFRPRTQEDVWHMHEATFAVRDLPSHKSSSAPQTELEWLEAAYRPGSKIRYH